MATVTPLLLVTVWAGGATAADWPTMIGLLLTGLVMAGVFVVVERRAHDPILPLRLFGNSIFVVASGAALLIGAARLGVTIYLPVFMQGVMGTSATHSGAVLIPLLISWTVASVTAGQIITRTGRYRIWPISGSLTCLAGFALLSRLNVYSTPRDAVLSMAVIGLGMGQMFQTYVVATQNAVPRSELGIATASIQFFRTIGATFGTAMFGSLLTWRLTAELAVQLGGSAHDISSSSLLAGTIGPTDLPAHTVQAVRLALGASLHTAFLVGLPLMGLALIAALALKELPLRTTSYVQQVGDGDSMGVP
jgi:hypothetical protein